MSRTLQSHVSGKSVYPQIFLKHFDSSLSLITHILTLRLDLKYIKDLKYICTESDLWLLHQCHHLYHLGPGLFDYCRSFLDGFPASALDPLQPLFSTTVRIILMFYKSLSFLSLKLFSSPISEKKSRVL